MPIDTTELQAVDFALGAFIASVFEDMAQNGPANYIRFLSRPVNEKIFRTDHQDAKELLDKITADKKGTGADKRPDLPIIGYFRKPGFSNGESISVSGKRLRWAGGANDLDNPYKITTMPINLDYTVTFAAWDKPSLDKICASWYSFVARKRIQKFVVPSKIGEDVMLVPAYINDPRNVFLSDASMQPSEQRLYACTLALQVNTQLICGESLTPVEEMEVWGITREYISRAYDIET